MRNNFKIKIYIVFIFINSLCYSQIDTSLVSLKLKTLTNDSLKKVFWDSLYFQDQQVFMDTNITRKEGRIRQISNVLTAYLYFREYGFNTAKFSQNNAEMYGLIIWTHCPFADLSYELFSLVPNCINVYKFGNDYPDYYLQNITVNTKDKNILTPFILKNIEKKKFGAISISKVMELYLLYQEIEGSSKKIVGVWDNGNFEVQIYEQLNLFYLEFLGRTYRLDKINDAFYFKNTIDGTFFKISKNNELIRCLDSGVVIEQYPSKSN